MHVQGEINLKKRGEKEPRECGEGKIQNREGNTQNRDNEKKIKTRSKIEESKQKEKE